MKKQGVSTQHLVYQEDYLHGGLRMNDVPKPEAHVMLTTTCNNIINNIQSMELTCEETRCKHTAPCVSGRLRLIPSSQELI